MPDELIDRLRRFHDETFPGVRDQFQDLVTHGQHPGTLFIGCSDSRLMPYLLTGTGPGELFMVRNVAAFVPPHDGYVPWSDGDAPEEHAPSATSAEPGAVEPVAPAAAPGATAASQGRPLQAARHWVGYHGTAAAIEFAVLQLQVSRIVVCGHSHCGGIRALYDGVPDQAPHLAAWLRLGREAVLPVAQPSAQVLRRTEQRAIVLQLERLMGYPMVRERVKAGQLTLHGWHYVIEDGEVHVFDMQAGRFVPASLSESGPVAPAAGAATDGAAHAVFNEIDAAWRPEAWR